jgi:rhodanese-related sulfurtransferase
MQVKNRKMTEVSGSVETLNAAEVSVLLNAGAIMLIDVREPAEYASERIPGALLYPLSTFDVTFLPTDGSRRVIFHCGSGKRSLAAAERYASANQRSASHMGGGIAAWKLAGLPVISPKM